MRLPEYLAIDFQAAWRAVRAWLSGLGPKLAPVPVPKHPASPRPRDRRRGLTLIEMMVSVALTLMVVFSLVSVFDLVGKNVTDSRAIIEMSGNLRAAASRLQQDLAGLTVPTLPPIDTERHAGYLEIVEGGLVLNGPTLMETTDRFRMVRGEPVDIAAAEDMDLDGFLDKAQVPFDTSVGDVDDILAFTTRSGQEPFVGRISDARIRIRRGAIDSQPLLAPTLESQEAEVIWWLQIERNVATDIASVSEMSLDQQLRNAVSDVSIADRNNLVQRYPNGTPIRSLHRRVMLVRPDLDLSQITLANLDQVASFLSNNDISVHFVPGNGGFRVVANSLGDLTRRRNRFCHTTNYANPQMLGSTWLSDRRDDAHELLLADSLLLRHASLKDMVVDGQILMRRGEDVVLSDVLDFDVRVYDPEAPVQTVDGIAVGPSDPGYNLGSLPTQSPYLGAFVNLGYRTVPADVRGHFAAFSNSLFNHPKSFLRFPTYDTWCEEYERDGLDQDGKLGPDQGANGFDDDQQNGVDDVGESETMAPFPYPLRGILVNLRIMEFNTRQVRQTSVAVDFLPE